MQSAAKPRPAMRRRKNWNGPRPIRSFGEVGGLVGLGRGWVGKVGRLVGTGWVGGWAYVCCLGTCHAGKSRERRFLSSSLLLFLYVLTSSSSMVHQRFSYTPPAPTLLPPLLRGTTTAWEEEEEEEPEAEEAEGDGGMGGSRGGSGLLVPLSMQFR